MNNTQVTCTASHEERLFWADYFRSEGTARQRNAPIQRRDTDNLTRFNYNPASWSGPSSFPLLTHPVELLLNVFTFAIREDDDIGLVDPRYTTKLTQICRYWRGVALGIPTLWAFINVAAENPGSRHRVRLWLIRTGSTCPLLLGLGYDAGPELWEDVTRQYLSYRHRWHTIFFCFPHSGLKSLKLLAQHPRMVDPDLTAMTLECMGCPTEIQHDAWTTLASSQKLRDIPLRGSTPGLFISPVPWHQLNRLSIVAVDFHLILGALVHCQVLEDLEISPNTSKVLPTCASSITLPPLRRLSLYTGTDSGLLIDCFTAPCLRDFYISQGGRLQSRPPSLHSFLDRS